MTNPVDELRAAAQTLRTAHFGGAMTATPVVAALVRARDPIAELLEGAATAAEGLHGMFADSEDPAEFVHPNTLAVARAINGGPS